MKKFCLVLFCVLMVIGIAGTAGAVPYTWVDNHDPNPNPFIGASGSYSYSHNITDNAPVPFTLGQDSVYSYSLAVRLYDDAGQSDFGEIAYVDQPGPGGGGFYDFSYTSQDFGWSIDGLLQLNTLGSLDVTIRSFLGDFYFDYSQLTARGEAVPGPSAVPEPSTMFLLLSGFMGIAGVRRVFI